MVTRASKLVAVLVAVLAGSAARADLIAPTDAAVRAAPVPFPWDEWSALLARYVDGEGRVNYSALAASGEDSQKFALVFAAVAASSPESAPDKYPTRAAREAYYLNAYNVLVWKDVLTRLPALKNIGKELDSFFTRTRFVVGGRATNLNDLESAVIRPAFRDPRVHMALNCASAGCPKLPRQAFTPRGLDAELDREARRFVDEKRNVDYNPATKTVRLSRIFDWYREDFGKEPGKVIEWINHYRGSAIPIDAKLDYFDYDWTLNDSNLKR